ncbi:hypothetical protein MMC28_005621 [Mycoblastus sanguinarius]|nr:hypothetical protein [Mycoblastus sanguinarius]
MILHDNHENERPQAENPYLGSLSILPLELRRMVWQHILPHKRRRFRPRKSQDRLVILRTNSFLHQEVSAEVYFRTLCVSLHPREQDWIIEYPFKIGIKSEQSYASQNGSSAPRSFGKGLREIRRLDNKSLRNSNFEEFRKIVIIIHACDEEDPGQILRLRMHAMKLVCALSGLKSAFDPTYGMFSLPFHQVWLSSPNRPESLLSLPTINLILRDPKSACCYINGLLPQDLKAVNLEPIIGSFRFLRNVKDMKITVPPQIEDSVEWEYSISRVWKYMISPAVCGSQRTRSVHTEGEAKITTFMDYKLDNNEGTTAALIRFKGWQEYEDNIWKTLELACSNKRLYLDDLRKRHAAYRVFSSMSKTIAVEGDRNLGDDHEGLSRWRQQYPYGIPSFNSSDFRELMEKYGSQFPG